MKCIYNKNIDVDGRVLLIMILTFKVLCNKICNINQIPEGRWPGSSGFLKSESTRQQAFSSPVAEFDVAQQLKILKEIILTLGGSEVITSIDLISIANIVLLTNR